MPTVQGTDEFLNVVSGNYNAWFATVNVPTSVTSPLYQSQTRSLQQIVPGTALIGVRENITGSPSRIWSGFSYRFPAAPVSASTIVWGAFATATTSATPRLYIQTDRKLRTSMNGSLGSDGPVLAVDTWYWVEVICDISTTNFQLFLRVNGVDQPTASFTGSSADTWTYGQFVSNSGDGVITNYYGLWKWGSAANNADWLGEPTGLTLDSCLPDADITTTGWLTAPLFSKVNDSSDATVIQGAAS